MHFQEEEENGRSFGERSEDEVKSLSKETVEPGCQVCTLDHLLRKKRKLPDALMKEILIEFINPIPSPSQQTMSEVIS